MTEQNWSPSIDLNTLKRRAQLMTDIRLFFVQRQVLEVDTPVLSHAAPTAPYLDSFMTPYMAAGGQKQPCYLHTSPEFAMKRLLAAGSGDIYQIARVFRNGELGRQHGPEFVMLEWYRLGLDYHGLMDEVDRLLQQVAKTKPALKMSYHDVFQRYLGLDIENVDEHQLREVVMRDIASIPANWSFDRDGWLELLMSEKIEPKLAELSQPAIVYDFPASQAQLAKITENAQGNAVAARFEVYAGGMELANGYDECLDADELQRRFEADNHSRLKQNKPPMPIDNRLLAAMRAGLPACTGVALGVDRLCMLINHERQLQKVQTFGFERC